MARGSMLCRDCAFALLCASVGACATLQQIAALRDVEFVIDRVSDARLAGVPLDRVRSVQDISAIDVARIGAAVSRGQLPMEFQLHLAALNPADNRVPARLLQMDWALLLDERETVAGRLDREIVMQPGVVVDIPVLIAIDLRAFFASNAGDLIDLALAVAGAGGEPTRIALRATPTIQTSLGPIRYPQPITIVSGEFGGRDTSRAAGRRPQKGAPRFRAK